MTDDLSMLSQSLPPRPLGMAVCLQYSSFSALHRRIQVISSGHQLTALYPGMDSISLTGSPCLRLKYILLPDPLFVMSLLSWHIPADVPNCWLLRSFSSLLLPLSSIDSEPVLDYFTILYTNGRSSTASMLMALSLMVSPQFISYTKRVSTVFYSLTSFHLNTFSWQGKKIILDDDCVYKLITTVMNNPKLPLERLTVITSMWDAVKSLAMDFADTAVNGMIDS